MEGLLNLCYMPILPCPSNSSSNQNTPSPCHHSHPSPLTNASFVVWSNGDFDPCFEQLVLIAGLNALFGIASALYAGLNRTEFKRKKKPVVLIVRAFISLCIVLNSLIELIGSFWLALDRPYSILLSEAVVAVSWCVHIFCIWVLGRSIKHHGRGPLTLHTIWFVTFIGCVFKFRTIITWKMDHSNYLPYLQDSYFSIISQATTYVYFGLQLLYLVTLLFKVSRVTGDDVRLFPSQQKYINSVSTQWEDSTEQSVRQHLISSEWRPNPSPSRTQYGTLASGSFDSNQQIPSNFASVKELEASEDGANPLSLLTFWWVQPLMKRGSLGFLQTPKDLLHLPKSLDTEKVKERFRKVIVRAEQNEELRRRDVASKKEEKHSSAQGNRSDSKSTEREKPDRIKSKWDLVGNLNRAFGLHYYPLGILKFIADLLGFAGPLLLHQLVAFIENKTEPLFHGYLYALGLFLSTLLGAFLLTHFNFQVNKVGMKIRAALITEIYRKALTVNSTTLSKFSTGQVVNFMSTDTDRIVNFCASFHQFWSLPFQVLISLGLLYQQVGLAFLAGLVFCILLIPVNRWLAVKIGKLSTEMMAHKDARVKVMSEVLTGIRVVKFYAWEKNFIRKILGIRALELKSLKGRKYLDALCVYFWATTPVLISILTFATYVVMGNSLTAAKVFTSVALFSILISPLNAFPWVINGLVEAWVSTKRVQAFLHLEELGRYYTIESYTAGTFDSSNIENTVESCQDYSTSGGNRNPVDEAHSIVDTTSTGASAGAEIVVCDRTARNYMYRNSDSQVRPVGLDANMDSNTRESSERNAIQISNGCFTWTREDDEDTPIAVNKDTDRREEDDLSHRVLLQESEGEDAESAATEWMLSDINLTIKSGDLVGVIGKVGSGKSSLLAAITAEMRKREGEVSIACLTDGFGMTSQEAWIQHATVRENILFGKPYQADKYRDVIYGCALEQDLQILPAGDRTEVGENGVTLSGGQKARVALARAVYQDKAVYLLDDPLSAVDAHVAAHLFTHCVMGLLRNKTRVLCTHHIRFLHDADTVVVMEGGLIVCAGPPVTVLPKLEEHSSLVGGEVGVSGGDGSEGGGDGSEGGVGGVSGGDGSEGGVGGVSGGDGSEGGAGGEDGVGVEGTRASPVKLVTMKDDDKKACDIDSSNDGIQSVQVSSLESTSDLSKVPSEDVLVKEEEKEVGVVKLSVYRSYWSSVGHLLAPTILLALLFMQASRNVNDWWLSYWISHAYNESESGINISLSQNSIPMPLVSNPSFYGHNSIPMSNATVPILSLVGGSDNLAFYLGIYGGLAAANSVFTLLRAFLYAYGGVRAAKIIHKKLLFSIMRAPISFFDVTPIGRIINRFSSDLYAIDDSLPFIMNILLAQFYGILGTLVITCYGLPWFALLLIPLGLVYYHIQNYYRRTSRELKRLSTVTLSPVYAHFSESLAGLSTIRALRESERFMTENRDKLDVNQRANFGSFAVAQWLGIRLQMLGVAMVTGVAFIAVLEHHFNTVDPGLVGLAISYALSITNLLSGVVTSFTETEKEMVSVERAMQYVKGTPTEREQGTMEPPPSWPSRGVVEFRRALLIYREGLPPALRELSFITQPMEKLGVVGRTGAGKSSLFQALFRMVELTSGCILIDGVNTTSLSLETLRSVLAVIPQDPFLFSGSIRDNLDPCQKHCDNDLWSVLERCHLRPAVRKLGGLDHDVQEKGRVFSVGQRQLICLARALLTHARVICIDEATASVDMETDSQIQQTIHSEFTDSTVITIAHRIETVLNSDRILVMEHGQIKELGTPRQLLDDHNTLFSKLFREHTKQE